jgi:hypothetical protein
MSSIVGRWEIVAWEQAYDDGRVVRPLGEDLVGFVEYSADRHVTVMISAAGRPQFVTGGQWDATDSERAAAYGSMLAYSGTYEVDADTVTHVVEQSLYPNWVGGRQRRRLRWRPDGCLALEARLEEGTPQARTARLVWSRGSGSQS